MKIKKNKKIKNITPRFGLYVALGLDEIKRITELREKKNITLKEIMLKGVEYYEKEGINDNGKES